MKPPKIIFLDIDGVLCTPQEFRKDYLEDLSHGFNRECLDNLEWLIEKTGAKIVISSSWRNGSLNYIQDIFKARGFKNWKSIIGETERGRNMVFAGGAVYSFCPRGVEIKHWLENNEFESYVIFDDDSDMLLEQKDNFIQTNGQLGLNADDIIFAAKILSKPSIIS